MQAIVEQGLQVHVVVVDDCSVRSQINTGHIAYLWELLNTCLVNAADRSD